MKRAKLISNIKDRIDSELDTAVDKTLIRRILELEEEEVLMAMAMDDFVEYKWGKLQGVEKIPVRISGWYAQEPVIKEQYGYSKWKHGYPKITFSKEAIMCEMENPKEYFDQDKIRYTSKAYEFRKNAGLPEIPEYEGLSEEKILELCDSADKKYNIKDSKNKKFSEMTNSEKKKLMQEKRKEKQEMIMKEAYKEYIENHNLSTQGYSEGIKDRDYIDNCLRMYIYEPITDYKANELYNIILNVELNAETAGANVNDHPELEDVKKDLLKQMKEQGLNLLPFKRVEYTRAASTGKSSELLRQRIRKDKSLEKYRRIKKIREEKEQEAIRQKSEGILDEMEKKLKEKKDNEAEIRSKLEESTKDTNRENIVDILSKLE